MAAIIDQYNALDGWDVICDTALGRRVYHFWTGQPADAQAEVDALETAEIAAQQAQIEVEAEDGTVV